MRGEMECKKILKMHFWTDIGAAFLLVEGTAFDFDKKEMLHGLFSGVSVYLRNGRFPVGLPWTWVGNLSVDYNKVLRGAAG